jgi:hypothetical protein
MAFPTSYVNGRTLRDGLHGTAVNLDTDTIRVALYTDAVTGADKNASESYNAGSWASAQVTSAGYTAGGVTLTNPSISVPAAGKWIFQDSVDSVSWSGVTFTARGALVYDVTASNRVLCAINFGADQSVVAGTFTVTWDATNKIFFATY